MKIIKIGLEKICAILAWIMRIFFYQNSNANKANETDDEQNFLNTNKNTYNNNNNNVDISSLNWSVKRVLDNEMLSDTEIFVALSILRSQFQFKRHISGFHDPQTFNARFIKNPFKIFSSVSDKFVQILHDGNAHWITLTNIGTSAHRPIRIFDSLFSEETYEGNTMLENFLKR